MWIQKRCINTDLKKNANNLSVEKNDELDSEFSFKNTG